MVSMLKRSLLDALLFSYFIVTAVILIIAPQDESAKLVLIAKWPIGLVLLGIGLALSYGFNKNRLTTIGELIFKVGPRTTTTLNRPWYKSVWGLQIFLFFVITVAIGLHITKFSFTELLDREGFAGAVRLFTGLLHPNLELLPLAVLNIIETIFVAFLATALAIPVAFFLCFFCAKNIMKGPKLFLLYALLRTWLNISRSIESLIWAIVFSVWVGIGPFAGMLALLVHSVASLAKQYSELVESISDESLEGIKSTGANTMQTIWFAIVPQVMLPFISVSIYRWDINVRMATIIGLVGGGGIGTMLIKYQGQGLWPEVGCIILVIAFVVWFMDSISSSIREALK